MQRRKRSIGSDFLRTMSDVGQTPRRPFDYHSKSLKGSPSSSSDEENETSFITVISLCFMVFAVIALLLMSDFTFVSHHPSTSTMATESTLIMPPLSKFGSLQYALAKADIVALYFAASWCSMSTPVTQSLSKMFSEADSMDNRVLKPIEINDKHDHDGKIAIVYVSSDNSEEEMIDYSRWNWINVPFGSLDRTNLKKKFLVCAQIEMNELGIEARRFHIPTLLIIDSASHGILSTNGVNDLEEYGDKVVEHWLLLQESQRKLDNNLGNG